MKNPLMCDPKLLKKNLSGNDKIYLYDLKIVRPSQHTPTRRLQQWAPSMEKTALTPLIIIIWSKYRNILNKLNIIKKSIKTMG